MNTMRQCLRAATFAAFKHRDQRRKDQSASPYINHPLAVANVLANEVEDIADDVAITAALLHDTLEDTTTTRQEIEQMFGSDVLQVVLEVTDDKTLPKADRKRLQVTHAASLSASAKLVKLADQLRDKPRPSDLVAYPKGTPCGA